METRIAELKHDLAADDFCLQEFFATEAAFRSILLLFNLLGEFQRAVSLASYRQPATLRGQVFLFGALLGRGPPVARPSVVFLGRPATAHPAAGKCLRHLNFAEIAFATCHLTRISS